LQFPSKRVGLPFARAYLIARAYLSALGNNDDRDWHRPWIIQPGEPCPTGTSASALMSLIRTVAGSAASNSNVQRSYSASDRASRLCDKPIKQLWPSQQRLPSPAGTAPVDDGVAAFGSRTFVFEPEANAANIVDHGSPRLVPRAHGKPGIHSPNPIDAGFAQCAFDFQNEVRSSGCNSNQASFPVGSDNVQNRRRNQR
jgi:hypothetical protein